MQKARCMTAKTALSNLASAEESFYSKNGRYSDDIKELESVGYRISAKVDIFIVEATDTGWVAEAEAKGCDITYEWDSENGGLQ